MKNARRTSLAIAWACATLSYAQSWCPPGAEWTFEHISDIAGQSGIVRVEYVGDTLLNGSTAQQLRQWRHVTETGMNGYNTWPWGSFFTRSTDDVVELYHPVIQQFDTLMWFAAQPGQHWNTFGPIGLNVTITVSSISTVIVDGVPLRQLIVTGSPAFWFGNDTLTERIGFHQMYIRNAETLMLDPTVGSLRCYHDDALSYSATPLSECGFTVGIAPSPLVQGIRAFPNPGSDQLTLDLPPGPHTIALFDPTERMALQQRTNGEHVTIDTARLSPGVYALRVDDEATPLRWVKR